MSRTTILVVFAALLTLAAVGLVLNWGPGPSGDQTPLGRLLNYRGPVERMVEIQTNTGGSPRLGQSSSRTVTTVAPDGRTAAVVDTRTFRNRRGEVSTDRTETRYSVRGPAGGEVVTVTQQAEDDRRKTVNTFDGPCLVREVTDHAPTNQELLELRPSRSITSRTCDAQGRTLREVTRYGEETSTRASYWWLSSRLAFGTTWNTGHEDRPPRTYWGLMVLDKYGHSTSLISTIGVRDRYIYDGHGNWVRHEMNMTPAPLAGNNLYERQITYRADER